MRWSSNAGQIGAALERARAARADREAIGEAAHHTALGLIDPAPGKTLLELVTAPVQNDRADSPSDAQVTALSSA